MMLADTSSGVGAEQCRLGAPLPANSRVFDKGFGRNRGDIRSQCWSARRTFVPFIATVGRQFGEIANGQHIEIIVPTLKSTRKIDRRHGHSVA
jgi:hypothetical protein